MELVAYLRCKLRFVEGIEILHSVLKGDHHWYLLKENDTVVICLDLIKEGLTGTEIGWAYNVVDQSKSGVYDCPPSYFEKSSAKNSQEIAWREKVLQYWGEKEKIKKQLVCDAKSEK